MYPVRQKSCVIIVSRDRKLKAHLGARDPKFQEGRDHAECVHLALTTTAAMLNNNS